ncbi:hypothetical protein IWZ00DRAFT_545138 [Phyllosticta capitalensis]|uniref:uncharacterized protein n=1 Tax=Phyllosticta capitalensis TaxID=121624 RepID=UPI00312E311B
MSDDTSPCIISMSVDDSNNTRATTFDSDTLCFPLASLPPLPYQDDTWTTAHISRAASSGELTTRLSTKPLAGVRSIWDRARIDVLDLQLQSLRDCDDNAKVGVIVKVTRFEWEIRRIERETQAYQMLEQRGASDMAPRFLGHVHEDGRVMGLLLEKWDGRSGGASIEDLSACEAALARFHGLGLLHGDANRYNFLVGQDGCGEVKLIDFECFKEGASEKMRAEELQSLRDQLQDTSGRGGGFLFSGSDD